jgi:chorismate dehydratase
MVISAVSYLNTKPFLYGLLHHPIKEEINLVLDIPSICASKLASGEADLGLVPVAVIPHLSNPHIISDYCIGAVGAVRTVCIYSDVPLEAVTHIYLDYQSRTSVALAQILLRDYWKKQVEFLPAPQGFERNISGTTAGVIIGDRAIEAELRHKYSYDLSAAWLEHTGLPFVFAAWVANRPLDPNFIARFNIALKMGLDHIPELIFLLPTEFPHFSLRDYYTKYIQYDLDEAKRKGLALFLEQIKL